MSNPLSNPLPNRLPDELIGNRFLIDLLTCLEQISKGIPVNPIPNNPPDNFYRELAFSVEQMRLGVSVNPLPIPRNGYEKELTSAIQSML